MEIIKELNLSYNFYFNLYYNHDCNVISKFFDVLKYNSSLTDLYKNVITSIKISFNISEL